MTHTFKDKVVLITGGTSGIGKEIARQLGQAGAEVIVCGRNATTGDSLVEFLKTENIAARYIQLDVQDDVEVKKVVDEVLRTYKRIDYVFNCAGIIMGGEVRDHKLEEIHAVLRTNVNGTANVSYYAYRIMVQQGYGHIVIISSGAGIFPLPLMSVYSASKFAVYGLSEGMRIEGKALGVRVSTVTPGLVDTPIYDTAVYSKTDKKKSLIILQNQPTMMAADKAARIILKGVARNKPVIMTHRMVHAAWIFYRFMPWLFRPIAGILVKGFRAKLRKGTGA